MQRGAGARRRVGHLAGIGLGEIDHVLPGLERPFRAGGDAERVAGEMDDVGEILGRIPGHFLHQRQAEHRDRKLRDGVAVGLRRRRHGRRSDRAAAAGLVVDRDRLAQHLGGAFGDRAHRDVGRSAGRPRHDQGDRLGRIILRAGCGRHQHADRRRARSSNGCCWNILLSPLRFGRCRDRSLFFVHLLGDLPRNRRRRKARRLNGLLQQANAAAHATKSLSAHPEPRNLACDPRPLASRLGAETGLAAPCGKAVFPAIILRAEGLFRPIANAGIAGKPARRV